MTNTNTVNLPDMDGHREVVIGDTTHTIAWDDYSDPYNSIGWVIRYETEDSRWWEPIGGNCVTDYGAVPEDAADAELIEMVRAKMGVL